MNNSLSAEMMKLLAAVGVHRPRLDFYALRHRFETVGGEAHDLAAEDHVMGHVRGDMASVYRERPGRCTASSGGLSGP
jgi:hypothetical protein